MKSTAKQPVQLRKALSIAICVLLVLSIAANVIQYSQSWALQQQLKVIQESAAASSPSSNSSPAVSKILTLPPVTSGDHMLGSAQASVQIVEYGDFECPYCKAFHPILHQLVTDYAGKVSWVFREFPLSIHANAYREAVAAECVGNIGGDDAFWKYADALYAQTTSGGIGFPLTGLEPLAKQQGIDSQAFAQCLSSGQLTGRVDSQSADALAIGIRGTPGTAIVRRDGSYVLLAGSMSYAQVKSIIDTQLQ